MRTLKLRADIPPNREVTLHLPLEVPPGPAEFVVIFSRPASRSPLELPVHDFGPWPENLSLHREDLYGDDGR